MPWSWFNGTYILNGYLHWNELLKTIALECTNTIPFVIGYYGYVGAIVDYDGTWIKLETTQSGQYPAVQSFCAYQAGKPDGWLQASVKVKIEGAVTDVYIFFFEPNKGDYPNYLGIDTRDAVLKWRTRNGGVETTAEITGIDLTQEHEFNIQHQKDQTDVYFYIDGAEKGHSTTNISAQPHEICCCETNASVRRIFLKYPKAMYWRYV